MRKKTKAIKELETANTLARQDAEVSRRKAADLETQVKQLQEQLTAKPSQEAGDKLAAHNARLTHEKNELNTKVHELQDINENLMLELIEKNQEIDRRENRSGRLIREKGELTDKLSNINMHLEDAESKLKTTSHELVQMRRAKDEECFKTTRLQEELSQTLETIEALKQANKDKDDRIKREVDTQIEISSQLVNLKGQLKTVTECNESYERKIAEQELSILELKTNLDQKNEELNSRNSEYQSLSEENKRLRKELQEHADESTQPVQIANQRLAMEIVDLEQELRETQEDLLESEMELEHATNEIIQLEFTLDLLTTQNRHLIEKVTELQAAYEWAATDVESLRTHAQERTQFYEQTIESLNCARKMSQDQMKARDYQLLVLINQVRDITQQLPK